MRLRTFTAANMDEAMARIGAEMGTGAVVLSSQRTKAGVVVRAARDETDETGVEAVAIAFARALRSECAVPAPPGDGGPIRLHAPAHAGGTNFEGTFSRPALLEILRRHRLTDALAHALAEAAQKTDLADMTLALASALDKRMRTAPIALAKTKALLVTGPHGAGKTAVAAKLAAHARDTGRAVTLIAGDAKGAGAAARLKTFADHLDTEFAVAESAEELSQHVRDCAASNRLAIIDSAGFDPRNAKARAAFAALGQIGTVEAIGVVSACGDATETDEIVTALANLGAGRLIVTGLDLACRLGALAAAATAAPALAHVTRSAFAADALETLTPLSLARALIEGGT